MKTLKQKPKPAPEQPRTNSVPTPPAKTNSDLPKGWKWVKLDEIAIEIRPGFPSGNYNNSGEGHLHFRPYNITAKGEIDETLKKFVPLKSKEYFLKSGDIVFNNTNSPELLGKTTYIRKDTDWVFSNHMTRVRLKDGFDAQYIARYLHFLFYSGYYQANCSNHVNQASISSGFLKKYLKVPLPPLSTQHAIVSKIEELLSELDKGKQQLEAAQQQLKIYRQAMFNLAIKGEATIPIESIIDSLDQGWSPKCHNEPSKNNDEWCVIKTTAIQAGYFLDNENKRLPKGLEPRKQHELKTGDLLITRAGPRVRVGICCMVKQTRPKLLNCDKVYRMRINSKVAIPEYIELLLNTPKYSKEIEKMKTGISDSGVNLTQKGFLRILLPIPAIDEQLFIVQEIESRLSVCDKVEETITTSLAQAETLRQSILKKAFEGKLV